MHKQTLHIHVHIYCELYWYGTVYNVQSVIGTANCGRCSLHRGVGSPMTLGCYQELEHGSV